MPIIKQGTTVIMVGPFLKSSNGYTRSNTQALSTSKVKLSKNDAALANKACTKASCVSTHGMYRVFMSTVDSGTLGRLFVSVAATACLPVWKEYNVVAAKQWNSIFVDSDKLEVDVVQYNGANTTALTTVDLDAAIVSRGSTFTSAALMTALETFVGSTDWNDAIEDLATIATADIDGGLVAFVGSTEWNDAIGGLSTLSTADLDTAISAAGLSTLSTGDLDDALNTAGVCTLSSGDFDAYGFSTLSTGDLDGALNTAGVCTLSSGDFDAYGWSTLSTGDLDGITTRLPTALTTDGNIKADAIMVNGETPKGTTDVADVILLTPGNLLRTDTEGNVKITTAARAEPGQGAPAVGADLAKKVDYLYKSWRNKKTQDSSTWSLYNDAGAVVDQKATISDDGSTATFGEVGSGA